MASASSVNDSPFTDLMEIDLQGETEEIGILLMGNTCSGKSALGNSILNQEVFLSRGGWQSVTKEHHVGMTVINGRVVHVVDTPGLNDTELRTKRERLDLVINEMTRALIQFPNGFNAVLLVIPYTKRVDEQERQTIETIVSLLDSEAVLSHGILTLSHGDAFKRDFPGATGLDVWMDDLPLRYQWVNELCDERILLFDNVTTDDNEREEQRQDMLNMVESLNNDTKYIPNICNIPQNNRKSTVTDKEEIVRCVKAIKMLGLFRFKLQIAVIDESVFTQWAADRLKEEARAIVDILSRDRVFSRGGLGTFLNKTQALDHNDPNVQNTANDIHEIVISLQLKIDSKIEATKDWHDLKLRVADFFYKLFTGYFCAIL